MKSLNTDMIWGLVLGAAAVLLLLVVYWPVLTATGAVPAGFGWPTVILCTLLVLSLLQTLLSWRHGAPHQNGPAQQSLRKSLMVALIGATYILGLYYTGFILATFVFATVLPYVLGRPLRETTLFSLGLTAAVWLLLIKLLNVPLPKGFSVFYNLSVWLF